MRRTLRLSDLAVEQLADLETHIAEAAGSEIAERYVGSIVEFCEGLSDYPYRTHHVEGFPHDMRTIGFRRRVQLLFILDDELLQLVAVYYGGQDWRTKAQQMFGIG